MSPPTPLTIATSSLTRLLREEQSYTQELLHQKARVASFAANPNAKNSGGKVGDGEGDVGEDEEDGNKAWRERQEVCFFYILFVRGFF